MTMMYSILANVPWHYWISPVLLVVTLTTAAAIGVGYLFTVTALRYPPEPPTEQRSLTPRTG